VSSLDYTLEHIDDVLPRTHFAVPELDISRTALIVMDIQKQVADPASPMYIQSVGGAPNGADTVKPSIEVIEACRAAGIPVIWSLYGLQPNGLDVGMCEAKWPMVNPGKPDSPISWGTWGCELADGLEPRDDEPQIRKHRFSTFWNTPLDEYLHQYDADTIVIVGVTSANCVHGTALDGWQRNYKVVVIADTTTALPHPGENQPLGTGQHWEALRTIQMNYGDVLLRSEFYEKLDAAKAKARGDLAATA
jgi:ureidoacrylate peracid hydrolase